MNKVKSFTQFIVESQDDLFVKLGDVGPQVQVLQQATTELGFNLPKFGIDSKFGPETLGAAQKTIQAIAELTNLSELVNDSNVTVFSPQGLTGLQYNVIRIVSGNQELVDQIKTKLGQTQSTQSSAQQISSTGDKPKDAYNFFVAQGYPSHVAAGIVANIKHESNFNVNAVGDGGQAKGLAQWHPDRQNALRKAGFNLNDFNNSLQAIDWELKNSEKTAYAKLMQASTPQEAAQAFDHYYERSSGSTTNSRMRTADAVYAQNT